MAAKNEEKCVADLKKRQEYSKVQTGTSSSAPHQSSRPKQSTGHTNNQSRGNPTGSTPTTSGNSSKFNNKCFYCGKPGHRMQDCRRRKRDAGESESQGPTRTSTTKQIRVGEEDSDQSTPDTASPTSDNSPQPTTSTPAPSPAKTPVHTNADTPVQLPADLLFSDSEEEDGVKQIRVPDSGSHSQLARVDVQGVPADGIVDTAADITIMGGKLFALVAATAKLRKRNFRKPDNSEELRQERVPFRWLYGDGHHVPR